MSQEVRDIEAELANLRQERGALAAMVSSVWIALPRSPSRA